MIPQKEIRLGNVFNIDGGLMMRMRVERFFIDEQDRDCAVLGTTLDLMKRTCSCPLEVFEGVPLTEDILFEMGFEWDMVTATYQRDGFAIIENGKQGYYALPTVNDYFLSMPVPYMHTLQNVYFYITGKELPVRTAHFDIPEQ